MKRTTDRFMKNSVRHFQKRLRALLDDMDFETLEKLMGILYNLRNEVYKEYVKKMPDEHKKKKARD